MLLSNFYVDNLVKTCSSSEALGNLYRLAVERLEKGGFQLRSCISNSEEVREEMKADGTFVEHQSEWGKVLGYKYNPNSDELSIAYNKCDSSVKTKRGMLAESSKIFDPLSLCLPVTVRGRVLVGALWKLGFAWDDTVPEEQLKGWQNLSRDLNQLSGLRFRRRSLDEGKATDVYVFCDASKQAYGFVMYAVQEGKSSMVFAKAKMSPLWEQTLPTLELLATYLALKCLKPVLKIFHNVIVNNVYVAVDAQVVLSWIVTKKLALKKNVFVKKRIQDISMMEKGLRSEFGLDIHYRYIATAENPADLLTRGLTMKKFR